MDELLGRAWWMLMLRGAAGILFGLLALLWPGLTLLLLVVMFHAMGAKVVAEGVETVEQHRAVQQSGIDLAQGYRYGMPMTIKQLREFASAETTQRQFVAAHQNGVPVVSENTAGAANERYRESAVGATRLLESGAEEVLDRITTCSARSRESASSMKSALLSKQAGACCADCWSRATFTGAPLAATTCLCRT